jgi:transposase-like protein
VIDGQAKLLDDELEAWSSRPLGEIHYLIVDARYENVREGGVVRDTAVCSVSPARCPRPRFIGGLSWKV